VLALDERARRNHRRRDGAKRDVSLGDDVRDAGRRTETIRKGLEKRARRLEIDGESVVHGRIGDDEVVGFGWMDPRPGVGEDEGCGGFTAGEVFLGGGEGDGVGIEKGEFGFFGGELDAGGDDAVARAVIERFELRLAIEGREKTTE